MTRSADACRPVDSNAVELSSLKSAPRWSCLRGSTAPRCEGPSALEGRSPLMSPGIRHVLALALRVARVPVTGFEFPGPSQPFVTSSDLLG